MKLGDIEVEEFVTALRQERTAWIEAPRAEGGRPTPVETIIICVLGALEHVFANAAVASDPQHRRTRELGRD
jgi:hypothetical protein